jgi:hypothetical protein
MCDVRNCSLSEFASAHLHRKFAILFVLRSDLTCLLLCFSPSSPG